MSAVTNVIGLALVDKLMSSGMLTGAKKAAGQGMLYLLSGFLVFVGLGFLIWALYLQLELQSSPESAAMAAGFASIALALGIFAALAVIAKIRESKAQKLRQEVEEVIRGFIESLNEEVSEPIRENPKTAASLSFLAGYLTGNRIL